MKSRFFKCIVAFSLCICTEAFWGAYKISAEENALYSSTFSEPMKSMESHKILDLISSSGKGLGGRIKFSGDSVSLEEIAGAINPSAGKGGAPVYLDLSELTVSASSFYTQVLRGKGKSSNEAKMIGIPDNLFANCDRLGGIILPENIEIIGSGAFSGCRNLKFIVIPNSVKYIDKAAFSRCCNLEIVLPESLESIEKDTFIGCESYTNLPDSGATVVIPQSVRYIHKDAFSEDDVYRNDFKRVNFVYCGSKEKMFSTILIGDQQNNIPILKSPVVRRGSNWNVNLYFDKNYQEFLKTHNENCKYIFTQLIKE